MALQFSTAVRAAQADAIESTIGTSPQLRFYSGSAPANPAAAATGTLVAQGSLPADWLTNPGTGAKALSGTWSLSGQAGAGAGTAAGYWRIYDSTGTTCHAQGTITATGGGGDITLDNTSISTGQNVTISAFSITEANA